MRLIASNRRLQKIYNRETYKEDNFIIDIDFEFGISKQSFSEDEVMKIVGIYDDVRAVDDEDARMMLIERQNELADEIEDIDIDLDSEKEE